MQAEETKPKKLVLNSEVIKRLDDLQGGLAQGGAGAKSQGGSPETMCGITVPINW
jgi:hypothetical protein